MSSTHGYRAAVGLSQAGKRGRQARLHGPPCRVRDGALRGPRARSATAPSRPRPTHRVCRAGPGRDGIPDLPRLLRRVCEGGFSLIELLFVVFILATTAGIAIPVARGVITSGKADSATAVVLSALQEARERAVSERRNVQVNFVLPNRIRIERVEVPGPGLTLLSQVELEGLQTFALVTGVPDTPDKFGRSSAVHFTGKTPVMFTSDGSLIDSDGDVVNGSIFLAGTGEGDSVRAVTVFGVTGLMRTWKWTGTEWQE